MSQLTKHQHNAILMAKKLAFRVRFYVIYSNQVDQFTSPQRKGILRTQRKIKRLIADFPIINSDEFVSMGEKGAAVLDDMQCVINSLTQSEQIATKLLLQIKGASL